ncbi:MAG: hypothetical protein DWQ36_09210 [Acidobacteria bacterium]|nr:MAG: hypothetical protein DWQ30_22455 [Acidobacteriota bacterium]REK08538.1 MAG: hypothetical protein DWQ36_09210 [Acidobacteriota bacterium]
MAIVLAYAIVELSSAATFWWAHGRGFSFAELAAARREARLGRPADELTQVDGADRDPGGWTFEDSILHPYLGYARQPADEVQTFYGFPTTAEPASAADDVFVVGITGGSVGELFYRWATRERTWEEQLRRLPSLRDARIEYVHLGLRGYKQPQQLLATAYYLALGGRLDLLVALDGFNELSLAGELYESGVFPAYPYHWRALSAPQSDARGLRSLARVLGLREARSRWAGVAERLRFSVTAGTVWSLVDARLARQIAAEASGAARQPGDFPYFRNGPAFAGDQAGFVDFATRLWTRSSTQLDALAQRHGFAYFHFLQPNLNVEGSKPLSLREQELLLPGSAHQRFAERGYPALREAGQELAGAGVHFVDLTQVFADVEQTLYMDGCCHFFDPGNEIVGREMVRAFEQAGVFSE